MAEPTFPRPGGQAWAVFERAATRTVMEWDVLERLADEQDDADDADENADALLDDLLFNFAERWTTGRAPRVDTVLAFLADALDEQFGADVDAGVVVPVAQLLVTLFEECGAGKFALAAHVAERGPRPARADAGSGASAPTESSGGAPAPASAGAQSSEAPPAASEADDAADDVTMSEEPPPPQPPPPADAEGWETVAPKGKRKGKTA